MTQGEQQKKLAEIFVLTSSLIDRLDELEKTETGQQLLTKSNEFKEVLEPILDKFYNKKVSATNVFTELERKIDYIFDKNIKINN